ncbi:MAG TPA: exonuclease SbcCD subunit D, partial [Candidatus Melainabacteria bacterium]|nr:exonuclease SbcCD subunit D [Candidatus Melainabacteria bacterium]
MTIDLIHVSDIHFGSGEGHGRINAKTGLNIRFEDFVHSLEKVVDYALENRADIFLFSGDAYKTANPQPIYQKMFARELNRLSRAGIATVLVVGNHDQILKSTQSHSLSVFQSLEVPGLTIIDQPSSSRINTVRGPVQLIGLPHITRNNLMTLEKYRELSAGQIDSVLVSHVDQLLQGFYQDLDPGIPTVVTAHMSVDRAVAGIEEELLVGYTLTFPTDIFVHPSVDYVALGHIHKYQVIREEKPAIVYAGSLDRVDFGEAKEDKGFVHVKLERGSTSFEFHSVDPRPFVMVDVDLREKTEPTRLLREAVSKKVIPGCVLRVRYKIEQENIQSVDEKDVLLEASQCLSVRLQAEVIPSR